MALRAQSDINISGGGIGLKSSGILAQSAVAASVTGTLTETVLATIPIPAGAMGVNGVLRIHPLWSETNNANNKTLTYRLGGVQVNALTAASFASWAPMLETRNRNSLSSQITNGSATTSTSGASNTATAVDMSVAQSLTITATLSNVADTVTLEGYTVELLNP